MTSNRNRAHIIQSMVLYTGILEEMERHKTKEYTHMIASSQCCSSHFKIIETHHE